MNPITHTDHSRQAAHTRLGVGAWDDFEPTRRSRRHDGPVAAATARTKAHPRHSHLSWSETPGLFLREEMS
jgi:hypothetical protein